MSVACIRKDPVSLNKTVVKVSDKELTLGQFRNELNQRVSQLDPLLVQTPKQLDALKSEIAESFVVQSLVESFAKENGLVVKKEALDSEIKTITKGYPDDLTFQRSLSEEGVSFADWQQSIRKTLTQKLVLKYVAKNLPKVTESEKSEYYKTNVQRFKEVERIELRQVVLDSESSAKKVEADWRSGKSIIDLAKKFSITPDGKDGGNLGWVDKGSFEIFDTLFDKPIGYKSSVLKSPFGYHLVEVRGKKPSRTKQPSEVSSLIEKEIQQAKEQTLYTQWLEEQLRKAKVFKDDELIKSLVVEVKQE